MAFCVVKDVFWTMFEISAEEQTAEHPDPTPENDTDDSYTTTKLIIHISSKTTADMRESYSFNDY